MNDYAKAWDALGQIKGGFIGDHFDELSIDQQLKAAEVMALLSIAQELSALNPQNTTYRDSSGKLRNGWGTETHSR